MKLKSLFPVIATKAVTEARDFYMKYFGFVIEFDAGWYVQLHGKRDGGGMPLELAFMNPEHESLPAAQRHAFDGKGSSSRSRSMMSIASIGVSLRMGIRSL